MSSQLDPTIMKLSIDSNKKEGAKLNKNIIYYSYGI